MSTEVFVGTSACFTGGRGKATALNVVRHICGTGVDRKGLRGELCKLEYKKSRISQLVKFGESENLFHSDLPPDQSSPSHIHLRTEFT